MSKSAAEAVHWADQVAQSLVKKFPEKSKFVCAAGISPSGNVHIGNFREAITVDLVVRALHDMDKEVRFIYSWDDCDALRKIPKNLPNPEALEQHMRKPIGRIPDPFGNQKSYAGHFEKLFEAELDILGLHPEYIYQNEPYFRGDYAEGIVTAMEHKETIARILNESRTSPLPEDWVPVSLFCAECGKDTTTFQKWEAPSKFHYQCECDGQSRILDIAHCSANGNGCVKLSWRIDWPMRWAREGVDFEPGGKDHSSQGGSFDTGKKIVKEVWNREAPQYRQYDFVMIKGMGGKVSSSTGNVITLSQLLEIFEPAIVRWQFASRKPNMDFSIGFDLDVLKSYDDFDRSERVALGLEEVSDKKRVYEERIYRMSLANDAELEALKANPPSQFPLRHLCNLLQIHEGNAEKVKPHFADLIKGERDEKRFLLRCKCAWNWIQHHAPEEFRFALRTEDWPKSAHSPAIAELVDYLRSAQSPTSDDIAQTLFAIIKKHELEARVFFTEVYSILIGKEKGPKMGSFLNAIGASRAAELLSKSL